MGGRENRQALTPREAAIIEYNRLTVEAIDRDCLWDLERGLCRRDLFYLLVMVLGRPDVNRDWLFERCREIQDAPNGYLDLWARDHYKSTIITFAKTIQDILINPEITIGIFSFNRPTAKKFLNQIKREFESNEKLRGLFPDILWTDPHKDAPKWSEDGGIIVRRKGNPREATIEAWGLIEAQPTSAHFNLMVYDDVITIDGVTNPDMIAHVTQSWEASLNLATADGVRRHIGTRWHYNDTYRTILDRGAAIERRYPITKDGTVEGEPVLLTRAQVAAKRRDMGPYMFASQNLLDPSADKTQGFKDDWIRYYIGGGGFDGHNKYMLVDAASSKHKNSDYTAIAIVGLGSDENYYLLDMVRDRLSLRERGDAVFALHRRWRPKGVGYERYGMMGDVDYIRDRQAEENYRFEIEEVGGQIAKPDRIRRMIPIFESGRFLLPESLLKVDYEGKHVDLVQAFLNEEYRPFPVALHDDMFDAIARIWDVATVWPKPAVAEDRYARARVRPRAQSAWAA